MRILHRGDQGVDVERWQLFLIGQGFEPESADANFGERTYQATLAFQRENGLAPDGVVGPVTWEKAMLVGGEPPDADLEPPPSCPGDGALADESLGLPPRPAGAMTGTEFIAQTRAKSRTDREEAILTELSCGNVPQFLRTFRRVALSAAAADGRMHAAVVNVLPDYLAIGSDDDFLRIPMNPLTAQRVADLCKCVLPTRRLVDVIYGQASLMLTPQPLPAGPQMMSNAYYLNHQQLIERQRGGRPLGQLTAGHKKDVVISNRLRLKPLSVAIYGWHLAKRKPIQPLSTVHENTYADYSHGLRFVSTTVTLDGATACIDDVLRDRALSVLLSDEGPLTSSRIP